MHLDILNSCRSVAFRSGLIQSIAGGWTHLTVGSEKVTLPERLSKQ